MMKILIVDDEMFNLVIAKDYLNMIFHNCEIRLCNSPKEVIGILENEDIDIVLLDIVMPELSGIDVLKEIRSKVEYNQIQVIMLTSLRDKESFKMCFEIGANDFIQKPIDVTEFSARIKAAIKTRSKTLALKEMFEQIKQQNQDLIELNKRLEDTQFHMIQKEKLASIGQLAAGVAHEINNPIGFIGSNLETMHNYIDKLLNTLGAYQEFITLVKPLGNDNQLIAQQIEKLTHLEKKNKIDFIVSDFGNMINESIDGIERISKIVQSLRGFARTGLEDEKSYENLNSIIEEALLIVRNESKYTIDIETKLGDIDDILCNKGQIGQVVLNLLVNSIQAIKSQEREERGNITIVTYLENQRICCTISDDGPGIPEEVIGRIFDPFFTTKDVGQGTGLGLSISHDIIVKKHNGELLVNSSLGEGTSFTFKLPIS